MVIFGFGIKFLAAPTLPLVYISTNHSMLKNDYEVMRLIVCIYYITVFSVPAEPN